MIGASGVAVRRIERADAAAVAALAAFGVATVHEAQGRSGLLQPWMRPVFPGARLCGTAVTVFAHPGDNWMLHVAAELLQPGDVVVVGLSSDNADGMFGELLATSFRARGGVGLVIDAGCRDVRELPRDELSGILAGGQRQGHGQGHGRLGQRAGGLRRRSSCSRATWSIGDDDGVVVVPRGQAATVAAAAAAREAKEAGNRARLAAGVLGLDLYDMREKLARAGLRYIDHPGDDPGQ